MSPRSKYNRQLPDTACLFTAVDKGQKHGTVALELELVANRTVPWTRVL